MTANITSANVGIASVKSAISLANTAIASLATGANANTAAFLTTYTGNISAGNLNVVNLTYTNTEVVVTTEAVNGVFTANAGIDSTTPTSGALQVVGGIGVTGNVFIGGNIGNLQIDLASGIMASGSYGNINQVLGATGNQGVQWVDTPTYFVNNNWVDLTNVSVPLDYQNDYGFAPIYNGGSYTVPPNQDPTAIVNNLFPEPDSNPVGTTIYNSANIAFGSIFYQYTNPTAFDGIPANAETAVYMWITPDGTGSPYWGGNAFWFPLTSPTGS
jgi:hypothetical protein